MQDGGNSAALGPCGAGGRGWAGGDLFRALSPCLGHE